MNGRVKFYDEPSAWGLIVGDDGARNYRGRRPAWTSPWSSSRSRRRAASAPPESDASPPAPDLLADGVLHDNDTMAGGRHPLRGLLGLAARRVAAHADPPYRPAPQ